MEPRVPWEGDSELVLIDGSPHSPRLHPVAQVRGYCGYLEDFLKAFEGQPDVIAGAAYLHNAVSEAAVDRSTRLPQDRRGRLFTGARRGEFLEFLQERFDPGASGAPYADQLINSAVAPSKQLLAVAAEEVQQREQFVLLATRTRLLDGPPRSGTGPLGRPESIIVVTGGPGSGKSVIALSLLGELARRGRTVVHATALQILYADAS